MIPCDILTPPPGALPPPVVTQPDKGSLRTGEAFIALCGGGSVLDELGCVRGGKEGAVGGGGHDEGAVVGGGSAAGDSGG